MEKVNLNKRLYTKNQYERVIDTKFSQLATSPTPQDIAAAETGITPAGPSISVDQFFQYYNQLFFDIPKEGAFNSHDYLIKQSSEYVNFIPIREEIQALIDEINILQQNNLELNQQIIDLQSASTGSL